MVAALDEETTMTKTDTATSTPRVPREHSKSERLLTLLRTGTGASLEDMTEATGWQAHTADLSAFAGQTIRLFFREQIPQSFTGPAQIEFDAISLTETTVAAIAEDDTYELVLTGQPTATLTVSAVGLIQVMLKEPLSSS